MTLTPLLKAQGLSKRFGGIVVAKDVNLELFKGQCLGVIGPNGAGKSSLFGILDGSIRLDAGRVDLAGHEITNMPQFRRARAGITRAYQIPQPFKDLTVFENVLVASTITAGLSGSDANDLARDMVHLTGLGPRIERKAGGLALLDRKRLELAKALATRPKVLMLDEIAGGLTEPEVMQLLELITAIKPQVATIWIEHVAHALVAAADHLMVLHFGEKIAEGPVRETLDSPEVRRIYMGIDIDAAH